MVELPVHNIKGEVIGQLELSEQVYAAPSNPNLLHQAMVYYQANQRQGTHSTKTRSDVSGGGRKPWPQKHTGPGAPRHHTCPSVASRRRDIRTAPPLIPATHAQEDASPGHPVCALCQDS